MWEIHSGLHASEAIIISGHHGNDVVQVRGLGGIGKSLLVEEYALRFGSAYPAGCFWLRAFSNDSRNVEFSIEDLQSRLKDQLLSFSSLFGLSLEG